MKDRKNWLLTLIVPMLVFPVFADTERYPEVRTHAVDSDEPGIVYTDPGATNVSKDVPAICARIEGSPAADFCLGIPEVDMRDGETKVVISFPEEGKLHLELYDRLGNKVRNLHDGDISAGSFTFKFRDSRISQGQYYVRAKYKNTLGDASAKVALR